MNKLNASVAPTPISGNHVLLTVSEFSKFQNTLNAFSNKLSNLSNDVKIDSKKMDDISKELVQLKSLVKDLSNDIANIALAFKTYIGGTE